MGQSGQTLKCINNRFRVNKPVVDEEIANRVHCVNCWPCTQLTYDSKHMFKLETGSLVKTKNCYPPVEGLLGIIVIWHYAFIVNMPNMFQT